MIIRACDLRPGDVFKRTGVTYKVVSITDAIYYSHPKTSGDNQSIGINSQERVELVERSDFKGQSTLRADK